MQTLESKNLGGGSEGDPRTCLTANCSRLVTAPHKHCCSKCKKGFMFHKDSCDMRQALLQPAKPQEEELSNRRDIQEHLEAFKNEFRVDNVLALGLWVDGVPYSHDRTQSVECVTLNLPAISQHLADLRLPLLAFPKFFLQKGAT